MNALRSSRRWHHRHRRSWTLDAGTATAGAAGLPGWAAPAVVAGGLVLTVPAPHEGERLHGTRGAAHCAHAHQRRRR